jgi:hypothetical protein
LERVVKAARRVARQFLDQPQFGDDENGDPYSTAPAWLGTQEEADELRDALAAL